jgi:2',3'-cyclic-nucleotide 2'-phosphodiesterase (5'-nucleotidase family)
MAITYEPITAENFRRLKKKLADQMGWEREYQGGANAVEFYSSFNPFGASIADVQAQRNIDMTNALILYARAHPGSLPRYENLSDYPNPEKYSYLDMTGDFVTTAAEKAVEISEAVNPFQSLGFLKSLKWVALGGLVLYFVAPKLVAGLLASKGSGSSAAK